MITILKNKIFNQLYKSYPKFAKKHCPHNWGGYGFSYGFGKSHGGNIFLCWRCGEFVNGEILSKEDKARSLKWYQDDILNGEMFP